MKKSTGIGQVMAGKMCVRLRCDSKFIHIDNNSFIATYLKSSASISSFIPSLFSSFHFSIYVVIRIKVVLDGWACADKVTVAVSLINTANCRPNLSSKLNPTCGIASLLASVAVLPFICYQMTERVW